MEEGQEDWVVVDDCKIPCQNTFHRLPASMKQISYLKAMVSCFPGDVADAVIDQKMMQQLVDSEDCI